MAIGAMTLVSDTRRDDGSHLVKVSFAGDGAYPTGGTLTAAIVAALKVVLVAAATGAADALVRGYSTPTVREIIPGDCGKYVPVWSSAVGLKVLDGGSGTRAEVGNGTNLSGTTFNATFICE